MPVRFRRKQEATSLRLDNKNTQDDEKTAEQYRGTIYIRTITLVVLALGLILFATRHLWGSDRELPPEIQRWRDNSYLFEGANYTLFYQDFYKLPSSKTKHGTFVFRTQPVLLILNGYAGSSYDWRKTLHLLQARFNRIIIPDLLGTGFSEKPVAGVSVEHHSEIVTAFIASLNLTRVHVMAHLYAEHIVHRLDSTTRDKIASLCFVNGGMPPRAVFRYDVPFVWPLFKYANLFGSHLTADDLYAQYVVISHNNGQSALSNMHLYFHENVDLGAYIKNTTIPIYLMFGTSDGLLQSHLLNNLHRYPSKNKHIAFMDRVGFYPHLENPAYFVREYFKFIDKFVSISLR